MTSVGGWQSGSVSTEDQYNLVGPAGAGSAAAAAAAVAASPGADYPGPISYCSRNHALVEDEKSCMTDWGSTGGLEGHKSWTSKRHDDSHLDLCLYIQI